MPNNSIDAAFKIIKNVKLVNDCWEYQGCIQSNGYSRLRFNGKTVYGHRLSYEIFRGQIKKGLFICHSCDNRKCINPSHLFLGTQLDNMRDAVAKGRQAKGEKLSKLKRGELTHLSKLNKEQVIEILNSSKSPKILAKEYMVSIDNIRRILKRDTWKHINIKECGDVG